MIKTRISQNGRTILASFGFEFVTFYGQRSQLARVWPQVTLKKQQRCSQQWLVSVIACRRTAHYVRALFFFSLKARDA